MTVINPSIQIVGDGPIEKIIRNIMDATKVRIPDGRGTVNMLAIDNNITVHINIDKCEFNSGKKKQKFSFFLFCLAFSKVIHLPGTLFSNG